MNCLHYGSSGTVIFSCGYNTGQLLDVPRIRADKRLKTGSETIVDIPGHEVWFLFQIHNLSGQSCESEAREVGNISGSAVGVK